MISHVIMPAYLDVLLLMHMSLKRKQLMVCASNMCRCCVKLFCVWGVGMHATARLIFSGLGFCLWGGGDKVGILPH